MFHIFGMQTITIRELRQNWPAVERRLQSSSGPLLVTRDGTPVARLSLPAEESPEKVKGFSAAAHRQWRGQQWGRSRPKTDSGRWLDRMRDDRRGAKSP